MSLPQIEVSLSLAGHSSSQNLRLRLTVKFSLHILCWGSDLFMDISANNRPGFNISLAMEANEVEEELMRCALMRLAAIMLMPT